MARGGGLFGGLAVLALAMGPAHAQIDFSGAWAPLFHEDLPERIPKTELGDYMGIPINAAGRLLADSYDADRISIVSEYQGRPHGGDYSMRGLSNMRIDAVLDPVTQQLVAFHTRMVFRKWSGRSRWMSGRIRDRRRAIFGKGCPWASGTETCSTIYTTPPAQRDPAQ